MNSFIWSTKILEILSVGIPLDTIGINNWGLKEEQAYDAISKLEMLGSPILGGDVCTLIKGKLVLTYDSWFNDKGLNEDLNAFVRRSAYESRKYIAEYHKGETPTHYFILVPSENVALS